MLLKDVGGNEFENTKTRHFRSSLTLRCDAHFGVRLLGVQCCASHKILLLNKIILQAKPHLMHSIQLCSTLSKAHVPKKSERSLSHNLRIKKSRWLHHSTSKLLFLHQISSISVAEPPLYWAAPAPEVRCPGADSGSGSAQIGSAPAPNNNSFHFELLKVNF